MNHINFKGFAILLLLGLVIWAVCGAVMFIGMAVTSLTTAMIIHALAAPLIAAVVSWFYFHRFHFTTPFFTAIFFTALVILMDFFVVALMIEQSLDMFASFLGTWLPFMLIFAATYLTGRLLARTREKVIIAGSS